MLAGTCIIPFCDVWGIGLCTLSCAGSSVTESGGEMVLSVD